MVEFRKTKTKDRKLPNVFNKKQLLLLFNSITEIDIFIATLIALCCGLRISEICGLKKQDVDFEDERIKVVAGKCNKDRYVMLPQKVKPILKKWFRLNKSDYVVPNPFGGKASPDCVTKKYRVHLREVGLGIKNHKSKTGQQRYAYTFHTLRHTYATFLLEKGVDLYYIQRALGHSDIRTTQIYAYISNKDLQNKINLAFGNKPKKERFGSVMDPIQLLQLKYANDELSIEEYQQKLEVLK